jgi:protease-4
MSFGKAYLASLLAILTAGVVLMVIFFLILASMIAGFDGLLEAKKMRIKDHTVLHMKLDHTVGDISYANINSTSFQLEKQLGLYDIITAIDYAKTDDKIEGIFLNVADVQAGMATVKEIRDALEDFQNSGKFIVSYNENYSKKGYYLSSVADEIYVFPSGMFDFLGLGVESFFLKGALEKLDIKMQIIRGSNNKFKSAVEPLMYDQMSEANRKQTQKYLDALWGEMLNAISIKRGVSIDKLNQIADSVLIRKSSQAVDYQLADDVKYYDEVLTLLGDKAGLNNKGEVEFYSFKTYAEKRGKNNRVKANQKGGNIAVIFAEGDIVDGQGEIGQIGGNSMAKLIRETRLDSTIKAVVLRVNSPGGSALASDIIWREVVLTKQVKPVIVSMGDVAASGGYYISCAADKIYAEPNTITGSIGVFGVIPYIGKMLKNKLGVTVDRVQTNKHSILSVTKELTPDEYKIIQQGVDDIYEDFISKVAEGRGLTKAQVDSIGQGRVWAGTDALSIGLIDAFGGINEAIIEAGKAANLTAEQIKVKEYSTVKTDPFIEIITAIEEQQNNDEDASATPESKIQHQLMDMYRYIKMIETNKGVQARIPYLIYID